VVALFSLRGFEKPHGQNRSTATSGRKMGKMMGVEFESR
jgi:hypothetical protein